MHDISRRSFFGASLALATPIIFLGSSARSYTNEPRGSSVTFGLNVPQTGPYADEGADQYRAFELAVEHLNGGGDGGLLQTFSSKALNGNGILGKQVQYVTGDTQTKPDAARASARSMIEKDGALMIVGGVSSGVSLAVQALCQESGTICMVGASSGNTITGINGKANSFRHFASVNRLAGAAMRGAYDKVGKRRRVFLISADYNWGWEAADKALSRSRAYGWDVVGQRSNSLESTDFNAYFSEINNSGADILILNQFGGNFVNSIYSAVYNRFIGESRNGNDNIVIAPYVSELMASAAGNALKGVYFGANWSWKASNKEGTDAFVRSFGTKYGFPPSQSAHTVYCQTIMYADACSRAGTFDPCGVVEALEGFEFSGLGQGPSVYWKNNHQTYGKIFSMVGNSDPNSVYDLASIVGDDEDPCDDDDKECPDDVGRLGSCNSGA